MKIKNLYIYPIKSIGGVELNTANCLEQGLEYDRRMMLVDKDGIFITQRDFVRMALIGSNLSNGGFTFYSKNNESDKIFVPHNLDYKDSISVKVWKHNFFAKTVSNEYSDWFSSFIGSEVLLVKMDDDSIRKKSLIKSPTSTLLSMADGYPYLFISQSSLDDLNKRLEAPILMNRFRPNIVVDDLYPYGEEDLDKFTINDIPFRMIKQCARCVMTTINQKTAEKLVEPLKTLSTYKKKHNNIYFGMNAVNLSSGTISKGDLLTAM